MRIGTFGSCLSRYTANHYVKIFGGKILTSVYHNRSDAFVARFIDKRWAPSDFNAIASQLVVDFDGNLDQDNTPINILKNQYAETMGLHRLSAGVPFLEALESGVLDLLFVDNYMDLAGKLVSEGGRAGEDGYFLRLSDFSSTSSNFVTGSTLVPLDGVTAMKKIISYVQGISPKTRIIFTNFPHNTYEGNNDRIARTREYEKLFVDPSISIIPCLDVPKIFQTKDKQHFKPQQYAAYAGIAWQMMR